MIQELIIITFLFSVLHMFFRNYFFPSTFIECNNLNLIIRNSDTFYTFKKSILKFLRSSSNTNFNCHGPKAIKLITRLRLGLSHLCEHKFRHPIYSCGDDIETTFHYLIHCPNYLEERGTPWDNHDKNDFQIL